MQLFILVIFGAFVLGSGAMLAPAIPTEQPRIGLASTLILALIVGGAVFWAETFGWSTLVIDYILFGLLTGVVLGGTLSSAQARAEARGEVLEDAQQGWPGPEDLAFFGLIALGIALVLFILPLPMNTEAITSGYLSLTARFGETFRSLAPFHPEIEALYPPAYHALIAYLSQQLNQPIPTIQLGVSGVLWLLCVMLIYDLGAEIQNKCLGRAMAIAMFLGGGVTGAFLDAHYSGLMALAFGIGFLIFALRFLRHLNRLDMIGTALMLGSVVITNPTSTLIILSGYVSLFFAVWLIAEKNSLRANFAKWSGIIVSSLIAVLAILPWLINNFHLIASDIVSPFQPGRANLWALFGHHGPLIIPLAILGIPAGIFSRNKSLQIPVVFCVGWLILIFDFAVTGILASLIPVLGKFMNPERIAWHGPIIPYTILGGIGLFWIWEQVFPIRLRTRLRQRVFVVMSGFAIMILLIAFFHRPLLIVARDFLDYPGVLASRADIEAMLWLRENAPEDARILNYPYEGEWAGIIAERDAVYFPLQPYFRGTDETFFEQQRLLSFWSHPVDAISRQLLRESAIDYVIVPRVVNLVAMDYELRWREPQLIRAYSDLAQAEYLQLVFEQEGARIYQVQLE